MTTRPSTPLQRRKLASIYREAAKMYEESDVIIGSCDVLHRKLQAWPADYARLFAPKELKADYPSQWLVCVDFGHQLRSRFGTDHIGYMPSEAARDFRVMALCFMAAITERP